MAITFKVDGIEYEYDGRLTFKEGLEIEKVTGLNISQWERELDNGSLLALGAMVFTVQRRTDPTLRFSDLDFVITDFDITTPDEPTEDDSPEA